MKIIKYAFVGGCAAVVDVGLFILFTKWFGFNYLFVGFCTFLIGTLVNYLLSIRFVFVSGAQHKKRKEVFLVYFVSSIGLVLNLFILYLCHDIFSIDVAVSKIISTGMVFFWNYLSRKKFVF